MRIAKMIASGVLGGGATWSPTNISGLTLWMDAGSLAGVDGDAVADWVSKEGNSYSFAQSTGTKQPHLKTGANGINGKPVVRFDGGDLLVHTAALTNATAGVIYTVYKPINVDGAFATQAIVSFSDEATNNHTLIMYAVNATNPSLYQVNGDTGDNYRANTNKVSAGVANIVGYASNGSSYKFRVNGTSNEFLRIGGANTGDWCGDVDGRDNVTIGALKYNSETQFLNGDVAEIIMYATALTPAQEAQVEAYLSAKYGIALTPAAAATDWGVVIMLDDGRASAYTEAFAYASPLGIKSTVYAVTDWVDTAGYCTWSQLQEIASGEWVVGSHTTDHTNLTSLTQAQIETTLTGADAALTAHGITNGKHVAYPYGEYDADTLAAMAATSMITGRKGGLAGDVDLATSPFFEIPLKMSIGPTDAASVVITAIETARTGSKFPLILIHDISDSPGASEWTITEYRKTMDYIYFYQYPTITITELYDKMVAARA